LVVANVAAELVSFSSIIDRVPPLRWFDRLGRPPDDDQPRDDQPPDDQPPDDQAGQSDRS
jgi:hypothetical protein